MAKSKVGEQFSKSKIVVGVLVRIANNVSNETLAWFQTFNHSEDDSDVESCRAVLQQRYMSSQNLWFKCTPKNKGPRRPVLCVFVTSQISFVGLIRSFTHIAGT